MTQAEAFASLTGVLDVRLASLERLLSNQLSLQQRQVEIEEALLRVQSTKNKQNVPIESVSKVEIAPTKQASQEPAKESGNLKVLESRCEEAIDVLFQSLNFSEHDRGTPPRSIKEELRQSKSEVSVRSKSREPSNKTDGSQSEVSFPWPSEQSPTIQEVIEDEYGNELTADEVQGHNAFVRNAFLQRGIAQKFSTASSDGVEGQPTLSAKEIERRERKAKTLEDLRDWTTPVGSHQLSVGRYRPRRGSDDSNASNGPSSHKGLKAQQDPIIVSTNLQGSSNANMRGSDIPSTASCASMTSMDSTEEEFVHSESIFERLLKGHTLQESKFEGDRPFVTFTESRYGGQQISEYDAGRFANITSLRYLFFRGSALRSRQVATNFCFHMLIGLCIFAFIEFTQLDAEYMADRTASLTGEVSGWVVFLLGPYFGILFGRWWTLRTQCLGGFWGCCDDICMLFQARYKQSQRLGNIIQRWMTAAWCLVELSFTRATQDEILALLVAEGMLSDHEAVLLLDTRSPPQNVLGWILDVLYELVRTGQMKGEMRTFEEKVVGARGAIGFLYAHFDTQVSFSFVHLMSFLMHLSNILSAVVVGLSMAIAYRDPSEQGIIQLVSYTVQHLVRVIFLQGMLVNIAHMNDPFGPHTGGMPLAQFFTVFNEESGSFMNHKTPLGRLFRKPKHLRQATSEGSARPDDSVTQHAYQSTVPQARHTFFHAAKKDQSPMSPRLEPGSADRGSLQSLQSAVSAISATSPGLKPKNKDDRSSLASEFSSYDQLPTTPSAATGSAKMDALFGRYVSDPAARHVYDLPLVEEATEPEMDKAIVEDIVI